MSEIERILTSGRSMRVLATVPSNENLRRVSENLRFELPASYIEFCQLGGLGELRFHSRVLAPEEILRSKAYVPESLVPFADNGCGDLQIRSLTWDRGAIHEALGIPLSTLQTRLEYCVRGHSAS